MNPDGANSTDNQAANQETGQPVVILKEQELETSLDFAGKVRRSIHRRSTASQLATYSWNLPILALVELGRLVSHFIEAFGTKKEL